MSFASIDHAAGLLADLRLKLGGFAVIDDLPHTCRPQTLFEGYHVQRRVRELLSRRRPGRQVGWLIGCATPVMQRDLKIPHLCAGTHYETTTYRHHALLQAERLARFGLGCEIAIELKEDLPPRRETYSAASVAPAVGAIMTAIGIFEHRFSDFRRISVTSLVADDFFSAGCVLGDPVAVDRVGDLTDLTGGFTVDGRSEGASGYGSDPRITPLTALAWLADHCIGLGEPLYAGQTITLGSVTKIIYPKPGHHIEASLGDLPPASVHVV